MTVYVGRAEMHETLDRCVDRRCQQIAGARDVGLCDLAGGCPIGHQRAAVKNVAAAVHRTSKRGRVRQVADGELDVQLLEPSRVAALAYEAAHRMPFAHQSFGQVPADKTAGAQDQDGPLEFFDLKAILQSASSFKSSSKGMDNFGPNDGYQHDQRALEVKSELSILEKLRQAEERAQGAEERAQQAELRAEYAEAQVGTLTASKSWKITAPLRRASLILRKLQASQTTKVR